MRYSWRCSHARRLVYGLLVGALVGCGQQPEPSGAPERTTVEPRAEGQAVLSHRTACKSAGFPTRWDATIAQAERRYLPMAWRQLAPCGWRAQLAAESGLNDAWCHRPNPQGTTASCLAQITRGAAREARLAGITEARTNPQASIRAGAWYLASMRRIWSEPRGTECRRELAVASYHAGAGTLLAGQRAARAAGRTARCYEDGISAYLPRHRTENIQYVKRVDRLQREMSR